MNLATFLSESADDLIAAKKHMDRCRREYNAARKRGDDDEAAQWDEEWDTAKQQYDSLKASATKVIKEASLPLDHNEIKRRIVNAEQAGDQEAIDRYKALLKTATQK